MIQYIAFRLFVLVTQAILYTKDTYAKFIEIFKEPKIYYFFGQQSVDSTLISDEIKNRATFVYDTKELLLASQVTPLHNINKLTWLGAELKTPDGLTIDISEWIKRLHFKTSYINVYNLYILYQYFSGQFVEPATTLTIINDSADILTYNFDDVIKII